jgi:hypothetical protein
MNLDPRPVILKRWELARCAANIMKVYFKKEKKPICVEIFIHSLKYINIRVFLILYTKCARIFLYVLMCAANQKSLRTTALDPNPGLSNAAPVIYFPGALI